MLHQGQDRFNRLARDWCLRPYYYWLVLKYNGHRFKIIAIEPENRRNPIVLKDLDNSQTLLCPVAFVLNLIDEQFRSR